MFKPNSRVLGQSMNLVAYAKVGLSLTKVQDRTFIALLLLHAQVTNYAFDANTMHAHKVRFNPCLREDLVNICLNLLAVFYVRSFSSLSCGGPPARQTTISVPALALFSFIVVGLI